MMTDMFLIVGLFAIGISFIFVGLRHFYLSIRSFLMSVSEDTSEGLKEEIIFVPIVHRVDYVGETIETEKIVRLI